LVVSTSQRRRGRTTRFFLGTFAVYLTVVASVLALSVVLAEPKLADSNLVPVCVLGAAPIPRPRNVIVGHKHADGGGAPDLSNVRRLEELIEHPETGASRIDVPTGTHIPSGGNEGGDPNASPNYIGVIGGEPRTSEPPPRPPDTPKTPARTKEEENRTLRVTSVVLQGKAIDRAVPIYPELAKRIRLQGDVSVEVIISPEGRVESVRVVSGHPMLIKAATDAALHWRFEPTFLNGVAVRVTGVITFVFKMNE